MLQNVVLIRDAFAKDLIRSVFVVPVLWRSDALYCDLVWLLELEMNNIHKGNGLT